MVGHTDFDKHPYYFTITFLTLFHSILNRTHRGDEGILEIIYYVPNLSGHNIRSCAARLDTLTLWEA